MTTENTKRATLAEIRAMKDRGELHHDATAPAGDDLPPEFWAAATPDQQYNLRVLQYGPPDAEIVRPDGTTTIKAQYQAEGARDVVFIDCISGDASPEQRAAWESRRKAESPHYADLRTGGMLPKERTHALRAFLVVLAVMVAGAFIVSALARAAHDAVAVGVEGVR